MDCTTNYFWQHHISVTDYLHINKEDCLMSSWESMDEQKKKQLVESYNRGVEAGVKQMMNKIEKHCELGKPVLANDELYFFKTAQENLVDLMDDIDNKCSIQNGNQYIVPMQKIFDGKCMEFRVIIRAKTPYEAWCYAYVAFEHEDENRPGGWRVYPNYDEYEKLK